MAEAVPPPQDAAAGAAAAVKCEDDCAASCRADLAAAWDNQATAAQYVATLAGRLAETPTAEAQAALETSVLELLLQACEVGGEDPEVGPSPLPIAYLDRALKVRNEIQNAPQHRAPTSARVVRAAV